MNVYGSEKICRIYGSENTKFEFLYPVGFPNLMIKALASKKKFPGNKGCKFVFEDNRLCANKSLKYHTTT